MSQNGQGIGLAGHAPFKGIPNGTVVTWKGTPWDGTGTTHTATIYNSLQKSLAADISKSYGNMGEFQRQRRRNKRIEFRLDCKIEANTPTLALAILQDPPMQGDILALSNSAGTGAGVFSDTQVALGTTAILEDKADVHYTPDGEAILSLNVVVYLADDGTALSIVALTE